MSGRLAALHVQNCQVRSRMWLYSAYTLSDVPQEDSVYERLDLTPCMQVGNNPISFTFSFFHCVHVARLHITLSIIFLSCSSRNAACSFRLLSKSTKNDMNRKLTALKANKK